MIHPSDRLVKALFDLRKLESEDLAFCFHHDLVKTYYDEDNCKITLELNTGGEYIRDVKTNGLEVGIIRALYKEERIRYEWFDRFLFDEHLDKILKLLCDKGYIEPKEWNGYGRHNLFEITKAGRYYVENNL